MYRFSVCLDKSYDVIIQKNGLDFICDYINREKSKCMIVYDNKVPKEKLDILVNTFNEHGYIPFVYNLDVSEESKSLDTYQSILKELVNNSFNRKDFLVAFGGGVTGDVTGFVAATYLRGIDYISVPTTLLSSIDSCVGGKCGINFEGLKNYVGSFYQPSLVFVDDSLLDSLPEREIKSGMGEAIKYALLIGGEPYNMVKEGLDDSNLEEFIFNCLTYKASIVCVDEKDALDRKILNFGHTIGHAIEEESNYSVSHGEAVANGILLMAKASFASKRLTRNEIDEIISIIVGYGIDLYKTDCAKLEQLIIKDKKMVSEDEIDAVVINSIGDCRLTRFEVKDFISYITKTVD